MHSSLHLAGGNEGYSGSIQRFLCPSALKPLISSYNICENVVTMEATLAKRSLEKVLPMMCYCPILI